MKYKPSSPINDRLVRTLRTLSKVQIQNTLMRRSDREIALAMSRMEAEDLESALSHIPVVKAQRVREEIRYQKRLKVSQEQYERIVETLITALIGGRPDKPVRSFIRPKNPRSQRR